MDIKISDFPILLGVINGGSLVPIVQDENNYVIPVSTFNQSSGNQYVSQNTTINGKSLSSSIVLDANDIGLGNVDDTSDEDKPISILQQEAIDGKASSAIQLYKESLSSALLIHDDMSGNSLTLSAVGATRPCEPGPGVATLGMQPGSSIARYESGVLRLATIPHGTGAVGVSWGALTATPGLTMIAKIIPGFKPGITTQTRVGFFTGANTSGSRRGVINITAEYPGGVIPKIMISTLSTDVDDAEYLAHRGTYNALDELRLAVSYRTLSHQQYFIQGGSYADLGCTVDSDNWFMLGETFQPLSGIVYPGVHTQFSGTSIIKDVKVLSQFNPSPKFKTFDYNRLFNGIHIPSFGRDPVTGLVVLGWNNGAGHVGPGASAIRYSVKLANGNWTDASDLIPSPIAPEGQSINNLSVVNGVLKLVYWKSPTGADGGELYWRTVSIDPSTGVATLGIESSMGVTGNGNLNFSPIITLPSGRLLIPYHKNTGSPLNSYVSYSDDNGNSWTEGVIAAVPPAGAGWLVEPTLVIESDGAVGCYMRTSGVERVAYYSRCLSPNSSSLSWSTPVPVRAIPQPGNNGSRMQAINTANGDIWLIGNDNKTTRRNITMWRLGDNAVVFEKIRVGDTNQINDILPGAGILQYPTIIDDGDHMLIAYSDQPSGGGELTCQIRLLTWNWSEAVSKQTGGTGVKFTPRVVPFRSTVDSVPIAISTAIVPNMELGNLFNVNMTTSTATISAPINPMPWEPLRITLTQAGSAINTPAAWDSIYDFNGIVPRYQTSLSGTDMFTFIYNPIKNKWVYDQNPLLTLNLPGTTTSNNVSSGALVVSGGAGIGGNLNVGGQTQLSPTQQALSSNSAMTRFLSRVDKKEQITYQVFPQISTFSGISQALSGSASNQSNIHQPIVIQCGTTNPGYVTLRMGAYLTMTPGSRSVVNFSRKILLTSYGGSALAGTLSEGRLFWPELNTYTIGGMTNKGFGWLQVGPMLYGQAHDGTTLRTTVSAFPYTSTEYHQLSIYSDGEGTCYFYVNGSLLGTLIGPTGTRSFVGSAALIASSENKEVTGNMYVVSNNLEITSWE